MKEKFKNLPLRSGVGIVVLNKEDAKEIVYGMPHSIWKEKYQTEASEKQRNDFKNKEKKAH